MNFEELKLAWAAQDDQSALSIDAGALRVSVQRRATLAQRDNTVLEKTFIVSGFSLGLIFTTDVVIHAWLRPGGTLPDKVTSTLLAALCFLLGLHMLRRRRFRLAKGAAIDGSMLSAVKRAREQVDCYAGYARHLIWFYLLPLAALSVVCLVFFADEVTPWVWIATLVLCVFSVWETRRDLRDRLEPEQKNLAYLRDRLLADEPPSA